MHLLRWLNAFDFLIFLEWQITFTVYLRIAKVEIRTEIWLSFLQKIIWIEITFFMKEKQTMIWKPNVIIYIFIILKSGLLSKFIAWMSVLFSTYIFFVCIVFNSRLFIYNKHRPAPEPVFGNVGNFTVFNCLQLRILKFLFCFTRASQMSLM